MTRWWNVLLLLVLAFLGQASSAQNVTAPRKVYFAIAGKTGEPRQQGLIKSLAEEVRQSLRSWAIVTPIDEISKWSADDAVSAVPRDVDLYVVVYSEQREQSGLGAALIVNFEVGRLEVNNGARELIFASVSYPQLQVVIAPVGSDGKPAEFKKSINGEWQSRGNSQIASEIVPWIRAMLPELEQQYLFFLACTEVVKTWTVADILSADRDMDGAVSAFLHQLVRGLEGHTWKPPWQSVVTEMTGPTSTKVVCGPPDPNLGARAHYVLQEELSDARDGTNATEAPIRGISVTITLDEKAWRLRYQTATPPAAPRWNEEFFRRKSNAEQWAVHKLDAMCAENVGVLTRSNQFVESLARYLRMRAYGPRDGLPDANWRCRNSEK